MKHVYYLNHPVNYLPDTVTVKRLQENHAWDYHQSLAEYHPSPLIRLDNLAKKYGVGEVYIKDESFRFGLNAFKGLGASYAIHRLLEKNPDITTFCTATDGNHGRAVAWASRKADKRAVVYVPEDTTRSRIENIAQEGAMVVQTNFNYDETCKIAAERSHRENWQLVQDTSWEGYEEIPALIMAGYLTIFQEMEKQLPTADQFFADIVFLQAGVGSWAGAAIFYLLNRFQGKKPKIVIVEPKEANGIFESLKAKKLVIPQVSFKTIMAGLNCGVPSLIAWDILKNGADLCISIEDHYAEMAIRDLYFSNGTDPKIIAGESGGAGLAGFLSILSDPESGKIKEELKLNQNSKLLFINTEGATDPEAFERIIHT